MKKMLAGAALVAMLAGSSAPAFAETTATTTVPVVAMPPDAVTTQTATTTQVEATTAQDATTTPEATEPEAALPDVSFTPDRLFYFLKVWVEQVHLTLTRDTADRAALLEQQAQTRLAEAVAMAEAGKLDLAEKAMAEAQAKLDEAASQIAAARKAGKELNHLTQLVEADQVRFAKAVSAMLEKLPAEAQEGLEPLTTDLLLQVASTQDAAKEEEAQKEQAEEAAEVAEEAGLTAELANLQPRTVLVLKAMAEASGKDLSEVCKLYKQNPGIGRIAKELGLKVGPVQHAAQIEWKKAQAGKSEQAPSTQVEKPAAKQDRDETKRDEVKRDEVKQGAPVAKGKEKGAKGQENGRGNSSGNAKSNGNGNAKKR